MLDLQGDALGPRVHIARGEKTRRRLLDLWDQGALDARLLRIRIYSKSASATCTNRSPLVSPLRSIIPCHCQM